MTLNAHTKNYENRPPSKTSANKRFGKNLIVKRKSTEDLMNKEFGRAAASMNEYDVQKIFNDFLDQTNPEADQ